MNDLNVLHTRLVYFGDNALQATDVGTAIRNNNDIGLWVSCQMTLLRNQWTQNRHNLTCGNVLQLNDARDKFVTFDRLSSDLTRPLFGIHIRQNLDDLTHLHGGIAMHLQNRQEYLIDFLFIHGAG